MTEDELDPLPADMHRYDEATRMPARLDFGWPNCLDCGHEYEPYTGDGEGACWYCCNGVSRDEPVPRSGPPGAEAAIGR